MSMVFKIKKKISNKSYTRQLTISNIGKLCNKISFIDMVWQSHIPSKYNMYQRTL